MIFKSTFAFLMIFLIQFLLSCDWCDCHTSTYEVIYDDLEVKAWNTAGFQNTEVNADTVDRQGFGLSVSVIFDLAKIAAASPCQSVGFSAAMACDCDGDRYLYPDPIEMMKIMAIDVASGEELDVTSSFYTYGYGEEGLISLEEFFSERAEWHDGFQFDLVEKDSIPNSVVFTVHVYLVSGTVLTEETKQINFFE